MPGRQQSGAHVSQLGPKRPSARFAEPGSSRSAIASRIAATNAGCVPALAGACERQRRRARRSRAPRRRGRTAPRGGRRRSRSAPRRRRAPAALREVVAHVGLEPRHVRRAAARLVDDLPLLDADCLGDEPRRLAKLRLVRAVARHRDRDRVRGERDVRSGGDLRERLAHMIGVRLDEAGMVVEHAQPRHRGRVRADRLLRVEEVLAVLPAARVRAVRRREERERVADAVVAHLGHRIGDERAASCGCRSRSGRSIPCARSSGSSAAISARFCALIGLTPPNSS